MASLCLIVFAVFAVANWMAVGNQQKSVEYLTKPAALAALIFFALTGANPSGWLIMALTLSLLGDVYLMLPANLFTAGLAAFLLAHLAYITDFEVGRGTRLIWWAVVVVASLPLALRILRSVTDSSLRPAVAVYFAVIALMVASAIASGSVLAIAGALLFFASDGIIAWDRFVQPLSWARPAIMITYHLGQLGLVACLRAG